MGTGNYLLDTVSLLYYSYLNMKRQIISEKTILFGYFIILILLGAGLLSLPAAWNGSDKLSFIDSLFTSVSAVCVTGLITVDTALYSRFGQIVILLLIQFGGLGVITFTTMFFISSPNKKVSFRSIDMIRKYYLDSIENQAHNILRNIFILTISIELLGTLFLWFRFRITEPDRALFTAVFHAVSAFCNAGFSLFSDSLMGYSSDAYVLIVIMLLIIMGGLGFLVFNDMFRVARKQKKRFSLHTKIVLGTTLLLIISGFFLFLLLGWNTIFSTMSIKDKIFNALFQAITPRTAGFNAIDEVQMEPSLRFLTMILMFIGGSPASIAGGIKTTTFAIVLLAIVKDINWRGKIKIGDRTIPSSLVTKAMLFMGKAIFLLAFSIFALMLTERQSETPGAFLRLVFESFSAFGTVGLSLGQTAFLSQAGKVVIIFTMFAGRVGLISLSMPLFKEREETVDYPEEEVLIG